MLWVLVGGKCVEWLSICVITPAFYILIQAQFGRRLRAVQAAVVTHVTVERTLDRKPFPSQKSEPSFHTLRRRAAAVAPHVQQLSEFNRKLILVPIVFFLGRLSGDVNVVRSLMEPNAKPLYWLGVLQVRWWLCSCLQGDHSYSRCALFVQGFFDPSQGFFNGLIFVGMSRQVRQLCTFCLHPAPRGMSHHRSLAACLQTGNCGFACVDAPASGFAAVARQEAPMST